MLLNVLPVTTPDGTPSGHFRVRRIICIGRNYADHALEMGHAPGSAPPFFFYKPLTALAPATGNWPLPPFSQRVDHELELVVALKGQGQGLGLNPVQAKAMVAGFALGLDMTCRDLQQAAKAAGRPWDTAKGFDASAPCTPIMAADYEHLQHLGAMSLSLNQQPVQQGHWQQMVWPLPELLCELSRYTTLGEGDLIFTGTPAGVGPVVAGDVLQGELHGLPHRLHLTVVATLGAL